jgi:hypothetical protein
MAAGMMVLTFALEMVIRVPFGAAIPVALITSLLGTVAVWGLGRSPKPDTTAELEAAQQRLRELEERLANLETITVFERRLAEETESRQPVQQPVPPVQQQEPADI